MNLTLRGDLEELRDFFTGLVREIGFFVIHREEWGGGFRVIGASSKRTSQLTATVMNLFIGYVQRNRIAVELVVNRSNENMDATLRCVPYLDVVDLEAPAEKPDEIERCDRLATALQDRILGRYGALDGPLGTDVE